MNPIQYNWLIIFVIHDFNDPLMDSIIEQILQEFTTEGCIMENKVLLIRDKTLAEENKVSFKTVFQTLEQESTKSDDPLIFKFKDIPEPVDGFFFHEQKGWQKLLQWINKNYQSKRTILITLSHGAGVGITGVPADYKERGDLMSAPFEIFQSSKRIIPFKFLHPDTRRSIDNNIVPKRSVIADRHLVMDKNSNEAFCKKKEILWVSELADALENGFGERKIDILMMANCFMQTLETGWILRNQVRYLVAPQTVFKAYGYSFSGLLRRLNRDPDIRLKKLIKTIIPDFIEKMKTKVPDPKHLKMSTVVINDLRQYDKLKFIFELIAGILKNCTAYQLQKISEVRKSIQNSSDYPLNDITKPEGNTLKYEYIDFKHFLSKITPIFETNPDFGQICRLYNKISRETTLHMYTGEDYTRHDQFIERKFGLNGISIFMPINKKAAIKGEIINCAYFGTQHVTVDIGDDIPLESFVTTSSWDEFVRKYIIHLSSTDND